MLNSRLLRRTPPTPMQAEGSQVKPRLTPAQVAPLVSSSASPIQKVPVAKTPVLGQRSPGIQSVSAPNVTTRLPLQSTQPLPTGPLPMGVPKPLDDTFAEKQRADAAVAAKRASDAAEAARIEEQKRKQDEADKKAAEDAARNNQDLAAESIGNQLRESLNPRDTAAEEALIRELMQDQLGQQLADSRAGLGRSGFGGGARVALEGDIQRKAAQAALADTFGLQQNARDEQLDRLRTAAGLDIDERSAAAADAQRELVFQLMKNELAGDNNDEAPTRSRGDGAPQPKTPSILPPGSIGPVQLVFPRVQGVGAGGAPVFLGQDGNWYDAGGNQVDPPANDPRGG